MTLFVVSFIAGMLTVLAPCVLPLLPVILAGSISETKNKKRPFIIIVSLSVSVFVFTLLLKGSTALIGASPTFWNYISGVILAAFGLTLLFPQSWARIVLKIPGHNKPDKWIMADHDNNGRRSSFWTDMIVGASLGPVFTTCSPTFFVILASVLPQSLGLGLLDLAAYIIGLALILLCVAFVGQRVIDKLGWATDPNGWFRKTLGIIFISLAVLIVGGLDKRIEADILTSGFFDITNVEQLIHQLLGGKPGLPGWSGELQVKNNSSQILAPQDSKDKLSSADGSYPVQISGNSTVSGAVLPPPPQEQNEGRYVEIVQPGGFINSEPFKLADFVGKKVILIDFIDYTCINCQRTFPFLNDWWNKYKDQGLEIVAIHTPEFSFEKDINNVRMGAAQFNLKFPIVLDNNYATWNAYGNEYWPHKYLIDIHGNVVYDKIGEGGDDIVESEIVKLLNDRKQYLNESGPVSTGTSTMPDYTIQAESPETYFGAMRNEYFGNGAPGQTNSARGDSYMLPDTLTPNQFYLGGKWHIDEEYAETLGGASTPGSASTSSANVPSELSYIFTAAKMYMIAQSPDGSTVTAQILIDGKPIPPQWAGADVSPTGVLKIDQSRLYDLYANPELQRHRIDIIFSKPGVKVYTFTFG